MYAIKSIPYVVQLHYKNSKNRKKKKQKFTTLDRLVMKIFRERGRTSRRGTRSFSSITTAALQNAQRVPAFSSSLFQLSLLLSFVSSLRTLFFLPVVSVSVHDSTSTLNVAIIPPLTILSTFPFPLHFATSLSTLSLSLPPPKFLSLSRRLSPPYHSVCSLLSIRYPLRDFSFSFTLFLTFSIQETWLQLAYFTRPASKRMLIFIHLSVYVVFVCSPTQPLALLVAPPRFYPSRSPSLSLFLNALCRD